MDVDVSVTSLKITNQIKAWAGQNTYFPGAGRMLETVLEDMAAHIAEERTRGRAVTFAVFDYVQLFQSGIRDDAVNRYEQSVEVIKAWAQTTNIVAFVGSQVRKSDTRDGKRANGVIDTDGALYIRDDKFNLYITLNPKYVEKPDEFGVLQWVRTNEATANIAKNSTGQTGYVPLVTGFKYHTWYERGGA
jgi:hypothetical protein